MTVTAAATPTMTTPSASASPTPTLLTKAQAAARYTKIVKPVNDALALWQKEARKANPSLTKVRALSGKVADANAAFVRNLQSTPWPADVQPLADEVAASSAGILSSYRQMSKAKTWDDVNAVEFPSSDNSSAQLLRAKLGLPEVPIN
ncbi:hypothetical protein [Kineosporia sp. R_H_3]|uniref:hypothetical protein n=1 Tax=Kineosporia sp. R_H_3 TaxID=1961848 RepID=UPI000B4C127A|nr:hypothetical protein [Kineosporia sp. R_H_3]